MTASIQDRLWKQAIYFLVWPKGFKLDDPDDSGCIAEEYYVIRGNDNPIQGVGPGFRDRHNHKVSPGISPTSHPGTAQLARDYPV